MFYFLMDIICLLSSFTILLSLMDEESKQVSHKVVRDDNGNVKLDCPAIGKQFAPEEISA